MVLLQSGKSAGLSGAIAGEGGMMEAGRTRAKDVKLAKYTKIVGIVFFVVMIAVSVLSVMSMN